MKDGSSRRRKTRPITMQMIVSVAAVLAGFAPHIGATTDKLLQSLEAAACVEGNYSCLGQCFVNGTTILDVNEPSNLLRSFSMPDGTPTPFFCNHVDGDVEEECGVILPFTGPGTGTPARMSFTTVADHRTGSPPFVEDFYFEDDNCSAFTKIVRAPGSTHMVCNILCTKHGPDFSPLHGQTARSMR